MVTILSPRINPDRFVSVFALSALRCRELTNKLFLMCIFTRLVCSLLTNTHDLIYSYRIASTGLLVAAFQLCQLTVSSAMTRATNPAKANIHQLSSVL